jgi:hypothetical protein
MRNLLAFVLAALGGGALAFAVLREDPPAGAGREHTRARAGPRKARS